MRAKRSKTYRKLMQQYGLAFGFREPYQVLVDAGVIKDAARFKMKLGQMLAGVVHGEIKPMITQCCIRHLYDIPTTNDIERRQKDEYIEVAKQAERRRCGHHELEEPLSALECLESVVDPKGSNTNKNRYVVATQELEVRQRLRKVAGVPLIYINKSVMILEPMAIKSENVRDAEERAKIRAGLKGRRGAITGEKRRREEADDDEDVDMPDRVKAIVAKDAEVAAQDPLAELPMQKKRKVKGPKGPNPLSAKKAKPVKQKSAGREVEDERAAVRKALKKDPQAAEKAVISGVAGDDGAPSEGPKKRKRKRKPKEGDGGASTGPGVVTGGDADSPD
ncbi:hypothetical protein LTR78_004298 [Recurvomyces mirabilis]|uniref:U three protein 23 n=1 Tax=Recurvomyces mirabilis TaxID=574656 RepID=A0AAE1C2L5_9PEZI|nr:hypothetical protein LTR78_004298 [Recurvomyces mirabilis]KAK5156035.1 hypothetical protein LTS14_005601 [Recurvomyces mirabilis]